MKMATDEQIHEPGTKNDHAAVDDVGDNTIENTTRMSRVFNYVQIYAFSLTFMSTWEAICLNMYFALYNGGPPTLAWGVLIAYVGALAQSASMAEMASIQPIAGAQYHWTHALAPRRAKRFITWIQGWVTWFGWISLLAGVANITALLLQSLIELNTTYMGKHWHVTLFIYALIIPQVLINIFAYKLVPTIGLLAGILHICLFFVVLLVLLVLAIVVGYIQPAAYVFTNQTYSSGWTDTFVAWNIGMLTSAWSFTGFDGALHMSEEVGRSKHAVPRALFWSIALNGLLAYPMVLTLLFVSGLNTLEGDTFPFINIILHVTRSRPGTTALVSFFFVMSYCVNLVCVSSVSRLTWAWARDGGLPAIFAYVSPRLQVPVPAVVLPAGAVMLLALLNIPSATAFGAIIALSSLGLYFSYFIAISCMMYARFNRKDPVQLGGWNLGRWGPFINVLALVYTLWIMIFLPFPDDIPVSGSKMNYAGPIFGFVLLFAVFTWFVWARKWWTGPDVESMQHVMDSER